MDLSKFPLVYLFSLSCQLLSSSLSQARLAPNCRITVVARLPQGLVYRSSQLILSDEFVGIYYHDKYIKYGTCLRAEVNKLSHSITQYCYWAMDLLVRPPTACSNQTLTGSAPLTGDTKIRTHCGFGRVRTSNLGIYIIDSVLRSAMELQQPFQVWTIDIAPRLGLLTFQETLVVAEEVEFELFRLTSDAPLRKTPGSNPLSLTPLRVKSSIYAQLTP